GVPGVRDVRRVRRPGGAGGGAAAAGGAARHRSRRRPRLGQRSERSVAVPHGVRVHRGVPFQRQPGGADHAAAERPRPGRREGRRGVSERAPEVPGAEERAARGPVRRKGVGVPTSGWFDPRGRALGGFAFAVNRITGLGLVFYLYLHLTVLSLLLRGEHAWSEFLRIATSWSFLSLDVLLLFGLLYHGLNGIRVALVGT